MQDALASVIAVVGLDVRSHGEIAADSTVPWSMRLEPDGEAAGGSSFRWIAAGADARGVATGPFGADGVWIRSGEDIEPLRPGEVALVRCGSGVELDVRTSPGAVAPPPDPRDDEVFRMLGVLPSSGVVHGTARFGPLADEVLGLPAVHIARTASGIAAVTLPVVELLASPSSLRPSGLRDSLGRSLVLEGLSTWRPPFLRDASIRSAIEHVLASPSPPRAEDLPLPRGRSARTLRRRFVAATGLSPDAFARWWLTVRVRARLADGVPEDAVAREFGYRDRRALRRMLARERRIDAPPEQPHPWSM